MPGHSPARILLVDDREENLLALEAILGGLGHDLLRATSGAEALKHLLIHEVSLILLDVQMPEMDGYETAAHIKGRTRTQDIPIIFLTAIDREAHQAYRGYAAGAVDFLAKPFDPWVLRAKVEVFVGLQQERERLLRRTEDLERRLDAVSGEKLAATLARVERLLVMSGDDGSVGGPLAEATDLLRALRDDLAAPVTPTQR
ncbi:MAG TPA: response regulator [Mycobacteriales bacterium]|jgi:CheY-like chemotaxis protein|nr:response regulator [Mycobacteriales bacterium]